MNPNLMNAVNAHPSQARRTCNIHRATTTQLVATSDTVAPSVETDTVREMEAADWTSLSDQELLERRISTLGLRLEGTALEPLIQQLYDELSAKGLAVSSAMSHRR